ncbi:septal ring lytic transglycosylase RlpA family protein [Flavilitoribacter nigricans]|uniref:Probable endolytic peptidoglycan transglycosylase RlpA n=1 Tax=Flavilitoribacter nigricans (strain ATCC 23147 / DSM 23189 / NBRC 102662 / NCIMB 1420 / SS-2) TaxID=1122177 RepID=A0A2D0N978_FLAN2|nr:septal ring lytic transglycosylase RlpA family protein [Flavilitoribacter nigricans]PHN04938.1 septal ring lytic transglycosylase RlpA family lipoprotein [Flavilitoribacter nigricans DSM 23189 = NBRC 102662]
MKAITFLFLIPVFLLTVNHLNAQEEEFGLASYYSDDYHGRPTAYGDYYDKDKLTAAHKKYPYGTKIKVTRLDNNKSVTVTVTDKGPYIKGRVVDLSRRAAESIGLVADGVAQVKVELVSRSNRQTDVASNTNVRREPTRPTAYDFTEPEQEAPKAREVTAVKRETPTTTTTTTKPATETAKSPTTTAAKPAATKEATPGEIKFKLVQQDYNQYGLYKIVLQKPEQRGFGVQIASLSSYENVLKQVADLQAKWFDNILISAEKTGQAPVYKVILGPFVDEKTAENYQSSLSKKYKIKGFVVNLEEIEY